MAIYRSHVRTLGHPHGRSPDPWPSRDQISEPCDIHRPDIRTLSHVKQYLRTLGSQNTFWKSYFLYCFPLSFSLCFGAFGSRASRDPLGRICMSFFNNSSCFCFFHRLVVLDVFFRWPFCPAPPVTVRSPPVRACFPPHCFFNISSRSPNPWPSRAQMSEPLAM